MSYDITQLPRSELINPLVNASDALARLDERVSRSPIKAGFLERQDFNDTVSSLWIDGELVHMEDLVLHDAHMDIRAPTQEVVGAHRILRMRRLISTREANWALSDSGLSQLRGKKQDAAVATPASETAFSSGSDADDALSDELAEMDALIARSSATLDTVLEQKAAAVTTLPHSPLNDPDWDEEERLATWRQLLGKAQEFPPPLVAAIMLDAWSELEVLQRSPWLGRQLAAALLRQHGLAHLAALNTGLRAISRERRRAGRQPERLCAILESFREAATLGMKEHDRLLNARSRMERRLTGRRSNSRLPELMELVLARPVVSTAMIVKALGTTPQGAVGLANQLELREVTGRGRFRAWGVT